MRPLRFIALLPGLLLTADLGAQAPDCNPPWQTVETFKEHLAAAMRGPDASNTVSGMVRSAFAPLCPVFREEVDRSEALDELLRFVAMSGNEPLADRVHSGLSLALRVPPIDGQSPAPPIPMEALRFAIEESPLPGPAVRFLMRNADDPEARAYLLELMRRERGPPARPNLPGGLVEVLVRFPMEPFSDLRPELEANPELIRNAEARRLLGLDGQDPPCASPWCGW